jgi:hypothetical protein
MFKTSGFNVPMSPATRCEVKSPALLPVFGLPCRGQFRPRPTRRNPNTGSAVGLTSVLSCVNLPLVGHSEILRTIRGLDSSEDDFLLVHGNLDKGLLIITMPKTSGIPGINSVHPAVCIRYESVPVCMEVSPEYRPYLVAVLQ